MLWSKLKFAIEAGSIGRKSKHLHFLNSLINASPSSFMVTSCALTMATANPLPLMNIFDWYCSCIGAFEEVTTGVDNLAPGPGLSSHETKALALQLVQDQIGRFRVWAGNMGAHRPAGNRMSLDYKLKEASHIHMTVVELLEELNTLLESS